MFPIIATVFILLILFILTASYICYRIAFYPAPRREDADFLMPQGGQYDKEQDSISKSVQEMLARPFEPVTTASFDGKILYARYYHAADGAPLQIQFHGYKSSPVVDFSGGSKLAGKLGQNALVVDQRSHGKSEGKAITFGILERRDCLTWIRYARERFGEDVKIILVGLSMGAATVLMAADLDLPDNVVGIMADCPYSSPKEIIQKVCKEDMHLPPALMYPFIKLGALLFGGFHLEESSAVTAVSKSDIPVLIIHGEDDYFVPCDMSRNIQKARMDSITLKTVPGAGHGLSYTIAPKLYEEATVHFMEKVLP